MTTKSIDTVGKDGQSHHFIVEQEDPAYQYPHTRLVHTFRVRTDADSFDWFTFNLLENVHELKVIAMGHNNQPEYRSKGIPEEMIRRTHEWLGKKVISSNNLHLPGIKEFRSPPADKAWKRLVASGEASYNEIEDTYTYLKEG